MSACCAAFQAKYPDSAREAEARQVIVSYDLPRLKAARVELAPSLTADIGEAAGEATERAERYANAREHWIESVAGIKGAVCCGYPGTA